MKDRNCQKRHNPAKLELLSSSIIKIDHFYIPTVTKWHKEQNIVPTDTTNREHRTEEHGCDWCFRP